MRDWVTEAELSEPDVADAVSERLSVLTALAALPEADRELLTLVAWYGLKPNEAARVVGCSTATYFVRLHRARRRLERAMADPPEPTAPGPQDRAVSGPPEPAVAGPPECAATDPPERAMPGPPDRDLPDLPGRDVADLPERDMADLPGRTSADSPGAARLGHPVLAHRKERSL
jgi:hypothetical protein